MNSTTDRDVPIPGNKKGKIQAKKPNIDKDTEFTEENEHTYGIDRLNLGNPSVESENDSK